jgi:hypothetical protein
MFTYSGIWNNTTTYSIDDIVNYGTGQYIAIASNTNAPPITTAAVSAVGTVLDGSGNPVFTVVAENAGAVGNSATIRAVGIVTTNYYWTQYRPQVLFAGMEIERWKATTRYGSGDIVLDYNGHVQMCYVTISTGGFPSTTYPTSTISGATEPAWTTGSTENFGLLTYDANSINWYCLGALPTGNEITVITPYPTAWSGVTAPSYYGGTPSTYPSWVLYNLVQMFIPSAEIPGTSIAGTQLPYLPDTGYLTFGSYQNGNTGGSTPNFAYPLGITGSTYTAFTGGADSVLDPNWNAFSIVGAQGPTGTTGATGATGSGDNSTIGTVYTSNGNITETSGTIFLNNSGSTLSMTLDPPVAGTDDGLILRIKSLNNNEAHQITLSTTNFNNDTSNSYTHLNFSNSYYGASVDLEAYNGFWFVSANSRVAGNDLVTLS